MKKAIICFIKQLFFGKPITGIKLPEPTVHTYVPYYDMEWIEWLQRTENVMSKQQQQVK